MISIATDTISCNSSYVLIGTTSDRLGTGAARPPAPRLSVLCCHGAIYSLVLSSGSMYFFISVSSAIRLMASERPLAFSFRKWLIKV